MLRLRSESISGRFKPATKLYTAKLLTKFGSLIPVSLQSSGFDA
jgi:hypothetical protein